MKKQVLMTLVLSVALLSNASHASEGNNYYASYYELTPLQYAGLSIAGIKNSRIKKPLL